MMTNKEYREHVGISKSQLFKITKSPYHFKYALDNPQEDTKALCFGRAAHKYILEKEDFFNEFVILPNIDRRTTAGTEAYAKFLLASEGKDVITADDFEVIQEMDKAIDAVPLARQLLCGEHEQSFFWVDSETGEACKCRPDCLTEYDGLKMITDYKTTDSCADGMFERSCRKYGYKLQAGMYTEGLFQNTYEQYGFAFIAQEKAAPYAVRVYICTPEYIDQGYDQFRELLGIYHDCKITNNWYGYEGPFNAVTELLEEDI